MDQSVFSDPYWTFHGIAPVASPLYFQPPGGTIQSPVNPATF